MNPRVPQKLNGYTIRTAHRTFSDFCIFCGSDIRKGQWYVQKGRETAHYYCIKNQALRLEKWKQ